MNGKWTSRKLILTGIVGIAAIGFAVYFCYVEHYELALAALGIAAAAGGIYNSVNVAQKNSNGGAPPGLEA